MVAGRLAALRKRSKLTRAAVARAAGISYVYLWRLERGDCRPSLAIAERLADALGVTVDKLRGGK